MFCCLQIFFSVFGLLFYAYLRSGIYSHLRLRKISKTAIKQNRKGLKNYWFYRDIQKKYGLGFAYGLNLAYFWGWIFHLSLVLLAIGFSWLRLPAFICSCLLMLVELPAVVFASINENREEFGTGFVLMAKCRDTKKYRSSLIDLFAWTFTTFFVYLSYRYLWL